MRLPSTYIKGSRISEHTELCMSSRVKGRNERFQEPINIECGINVDPFDYETEGV